MAIIILQAIWYMLPAYFANMAPVFCKNTLKFLDKPVNSRVFGSHKTWRGLFVGAVFGIIVAYLQHTTYSDYVWAVNISLVNYQQWFLLGLLMGAGAMLGDLVKSFFKRRIGIKPGERWLGFDQLDYVIGALLFTSIIYVPSLIVILAILLISFLGNIIVNHIAYWLKIRKVKW